jgi:DmsE family decaheme c-type cytochrome
MKTKVITLGCFAILFLAFAIAGNLSKVTSSTEQSLPGTNADDYVGSESCKACHEEQYASIAATVHGKAEGSRWKDNVQSCESCHGPGKAHVEGGGDAAKIGSFKKRTAHENSQTCMGCHSQTSDHATWRGSKHESAGLSCVDCHSAHQAQKKLVSELPLFANVQSETKLLKKRSEADTCYQCHSDVRKSEFQRSTHLFKTEDRDARMTCSACHDAHGSVGDKLMKTTSVNDTCYTCHTEKRGPFLWEHGPVRENCANCHKAHGSNHTALLKARTPMLCQSCHIQGRHQTVAGKPTSTFMFNRSCTNCHSAIHGSNHPSGINLQK